MPPEIINKSNIDVSTACLVEAVGALLEDDFGIVVEAYDYDEDGELKKFLVYKSEGSVKVSVMREDVKLESGQLIQIYDGVYH